MVTLHMLLAILIVFVLLYLLLASYAEQLTSLFPKGNMRLNRLILINLGFSLIQLIMGTQVREEMDHVIARLGYLARFEWIENLNFLFYVHRSFSILILVVGFILFYQVYRQKASPQLVRKLVAINLLIIVLEIATGVSMAYFGVPAFSQPIHLLMSILLMGVQFIVWVVVNAEWLFKKWTSPKYLQSVIP
ncbi:heme A synthase [Rhabdobacter roseus]|uniref:Heme A synthase n=2 Tax=Rhabdobacter roseus TaxID=1655419 RepID=A0A840TX96_9BACT|nr:heme A synthase [Rhabdobacter roseus]